MPSTLDSSEHNHPSATTPPPSSPSESEMIVCEMLTMEQQQGRSARNPEQVEGDSADREREDSNGDGMLACPCVTDGIRCSGTFPTRNALIVHILAEHRPRIDDEHFTEEEVDGQSGL
ncbi:hypothetical protein NMY22_g10140 [Coprinellus aureogranulatus]|nr:hypothetical protein NMY22_g10140 [Coprinellus aureogranulatus]